MPQREPLSLAARDSREALIGADLVHWGAAAWAERIFGRNRLDNARQALLGQRQALRP